MLRKASTRLQDASQSFNEASGCFTELRCGFRMLRRASLRRQDTFLVLPSGSGGYPAVSAKRGTFHEGVGVMGLYNPRTV